MTVSSTVRTAGPFVRNGSQVDYPFSFRIFVDTDVLAVQTDLAGSKDTLTLGADYTISVNTDQRTNPGGTLTMLDGGGVSGYTLDLTTNLEATQGLSLTLGGSFDPEAIENALDKTVILLQQQGVFGEQSVRAPFPEVLTELPASSARANRILAFDSSGNPTALVGAVADSATALQLDLASTATGKGSKLIAWIRRAAGAVARWVEDKLAEMSSVDDFGADPTGVADSSAAFQACAAANRYWSIPNGGTYKIATPIVLPNNSHIVGLGMPTLNAATNGQHIFQATSVSGIYIRGVKFVGTSASTVPTTNVGGVGAAQTGLVSLVSVSDVRIEDCEFSTFYNGVMAMRCSRVWIERNRIISYHLHGILASQSAYAVLTRNVITGCTQNGAAIAYAIHATGDQAGGYTSSRCVITYNIISGVPSWDGVMTHDFDGLIVAHNDIRDVRAGIDIGHYQATNVIKNVLVANNVIEASTSNTWGASAANSFGITVSGYDATNRVQRAVVAGNIVSGFFNAVGMVGGGVPSNIVVSNIDDVTVSGNSVSGAGSVISNAGIYALGTINRMSLVGNTLQGSMALGGIRLTGVTADVACIGWNSIKQTTSSVEAVLVSGSTISAFSLGDNATNSTTPWSQSASTITFSGMRLEGSKTYDPPSVANGAQTTTTVTVPGAQVGDFALASFGGALSGMRLSAEITAADTATALFRNDSGGAVDLGSSTLRVAAFRKLT